VSSCSEPEPKRKFRRSTDPELARKDLARLLQDAVSSGFVVLVPSLPAASTMAIGAVE